MAIEIMPEEYKVISRTADYLFFRHRVLSPDELVSIMTLWMMEHPETVRRIRALDRGLNLTLRRVGMRAIQVERAYQRGYDPSDQFRYPPGLLFELLKQALPLDRDLSDEGGEQAKVRSGNRADPAFGGDRLAMLIDVRQGIERLSPAMQQRLHEAVDEDFEYPDLARRWSTEEKPVSTETARLRVKRAIQALSDLLSEPRTEQEVQQYTGSKTVVPNARAQSAIAIGASAPTGGRSPWLEGGILS